jgi:hypothetical protein
MNEPNRNNENHNKQIHVNALRKNTADMDYKQLFDF